MFSDPCRTFGEEFTLKNEKVRPFDSLGLIRSSEVMRASERGLPPPLDPVFNLERSFFFL